jgi:hypothetical protein
MDIAHNIFYSTFPFLTFWGLVIQALYYLGPLRKFQESVLLLTIFISIGGFILIYFHPKLVKLNLKYNGELRELTISGKMLKIIDLAFHQLPLILLLILYNPKIKTDNMWLALMTFVVYFLIADPIKAYSIDCKDKKGQHICSLLLTINILLIGFFFIFLLQKMFN